MAECRKARFPSKQAANARLDAIDAEPRRVGQAKIPVRAYRCRRCWGWHLTSRVSRSVWQRRRKLA